MNRNESRKKVAALVTEYRHDSHAELILSRLLGEFGYDSRLEVISLYIDQFPDNDMSREIAEKYGIPIYPTIEETIKAEGTGSTIDGVIIIGEQGNYPFNEKDQKLYPRKLWMEKTLTTLDEMDIKVPIFSDKHFSYDTREAAWVYHQLKRREIPFLGGSSIPFLEPFPHLEDKTLKTINEIFVVGIRENEVNGFHAMDVLQSLVEKRQGGETGVASIHAIEGDEVWDAMDRGEWEEPLMVEALSKQVTPVEGHPRDHVINPALFTIQYVDGTKGYVLQLENFITHWSFAIRHHGDYVVSARMPPSTRPYVHFEKLTQAIEDLIITGEAPFPMERTYVSTELINLSMESLYQKRALDTPELLHVKY